MDRGITEQVSNGIGYSPRENKWYGWSHRVIYGFTIGSTCNKGDCHYRASNLEEELEDAELFWHDDTHAYTKAHVNPLGEIIVEWKYNDKAPNTDVHGTVGNTQWHYDPNNYGRGEWVAETMEDARQMAMDFHKGVA